MVQAGVRGPYTRKYLIHILEIYLNSAFADGRIVCHQDSHLEPLHKDLEVGDWVHNVCEVRGEGESPEEIQSFDTGDFSVVGCADLTFLGPSRSAG